MDAARREDLMRKALALALESVREGGGPFGALVVRGDAVLATGKNRVTLHNDPTAHAEIVAVREACRATGTWALAGCEVFASCEPCPMCLAALYWARVERVWYAADRRDAAAAGFDDQRIHAELARPPEARALPLGELLPGEGRAPFAAWAALTERRGY
jgi:tRNA(Arg) A34 adenosine deaminase TadA